MRQFGFAIVGCGAIAEIHRKAIESIPNANLKCVWNRTKKKAESFADKAGCQVEDELDRLVTRDDVDIVIVTTASGYHLEPATKAARAGKHVIVEKPLEVTTQRCDEIIKAVDDANVNLACIFQSRFCPANQKVYEAVRNKEFGRPILADAHVKWYREKAYYEQAAWRGTKALDGGGALMNQAIHHVDLLQWIMGPVKWVSAQTDCLAHDSIEVEDTAIAILRFESNAVGVIEATTSVYPGYPKRLEIHGDMGGAVVVDDYLEDWQSRKNSDEENRKLVEKYSQGERTGTFSDPMALGHDRHQRQIVDFMKAIEENRPPGIDGREGRRAVEIVEAVYASARSGQPVVLDLFLR